MYRFPSRRSVVRSHKGIVASSQPLANAAGLRILDAGGSCADAAVAVAAALCVTEPPSTGIGGDCFVLHYSKRGVEALCGHGRSPKNLSINVAKRMHQGPRLPETSPHAVTVPGAVAGWLDTIAKWGSGSVSVGQILQPATTLARNGFPVSDVSARLWADASPRLVLQSGANARVFLNHDGSFVQPGQLFRNKPLADVFDKIALEGRDGFYKGPVAQSIVNAVQSRGGVMELTDLASHKLTFEEPLYMDFQGKRLWEIPPSGQGIVALLALGYIRELSEAQRVDLAKMTHNSAEYLHLLVEALKLAFYDLEHVVADLTFHPEIDVASFLKKEHLQKRMRLIKQDRVLAREDIDIVPNPDYHSDTVYFTVADSQGNACLFINSVFSPFGSGIVTDHGFALQSRGANFNLTPGAINLLEGGKQPYHTIIPAMVTEGDELWASVACMGGWAQPQAHVQIFLNMVLFGFSPQEALDAPRFCLEPNEEKRHLDVGKGSFGPVSTPATLLRLEEGIDATAVQRLAELGHVVNIVSDWDRLVFGRGQCIKNEGHGTINWAAGSDPRGDGAAVPQI